MRHLRRQFHREFDVACELAVLKPRGLVNQLFHAVLLDGLGVEVVVFQHFHQFGAGWLWMAVQQVLPDDVLAVTEHALGGFVHFQNFTVFVANRDGKRDIVKIFQHNLCF